MLIRVFQFHFLTDGHTVFGHDGIAEALVNNHIATSWSHRDSNSFGQCLHTALQLDAGSIVKQKLLCHFKGSFSDQTLR
jgi:hypothetical protein